MKVVDWEKSRRPGMVAWIVMRVIHYRIRYYCGGELGWTDSHLMAWCSEDREQAYAVREKVSGLILIVE